MGEAKAFLKEMEPLHKVLQFSDYGQYPLATSVWAAIEDVRLTCKSKHLLRGPKNSKKPSSIAPLVYENGTT